MGGRLWSFAAERWEERVDEEEEGAVKYRPEWEDSEEGRLVAGSLRVGILWTPGGGGGLKEGGESDLDRTSSYEGRGRGQERRCCHSDTICCG